MNLKIAQRLLLAVRDTPDDMFDYAEYESDITVSECGCALVVLGRIGHLDKEGNVYSPFEAGELIGISQVDANFLFMNERGINGPLTPDQLRGASGKAEFERRWIDVFGEENLPK